jgi:hypothetical protein
MFSISNSNDLLLQLLVPSMESMSKKEKPPITTSRILVLLPLPKLPISLRNLKQIVKNRM